MTETLFEAACRHIQAGRSVIPLKILYDAAGKKSVRPSGPWKKYQTQLPTLIEAQTWFEQRQCTQLGMVLGRVSGGIWIMDADGPAAVEWMAKNAPPTTVYAVTRRGVHAYYRMPEGVDVSCDVDVVADLKDETGDQIDVKGTGGIATIPPSPHSEGCYEWKSEDWENLPVWSPPLKIKKLLRLVHRENAGELMGNGRTEGVRNTTLASLAGQLVASGYNEEYVGNWALNWNSMNNPPLDVEEIERTVRSIFELHNKNHAIHGVAWTEDIEIDDFSGDAEPEPDDVPIPAELLKPGGMLGQMMTYIDSRAYHPTPPLFALAAAMVTVGTLVGQKVQTETGLRTNLYVIALADSGVGKNLPMTALEQLLYEAGVESYLGPKRFASDAALIKCVSTFEAPNQRALMAFMDEIGDLLCVLKGKQQTSKLETVSLMKELFSSTGSVYTKVYADADKNITVYHPHFSFYGTGVPLRFWEAIDFEDVIDGFLARCLVLSDESEIKKGTIPEFKPAPKSLIRSLQNLADIQVAMAGNLSQIPLPTMVPKDAEAMKYFDDWQDEVVMKQNKYRKDKRGKGAVYNRMAENASKLALIHAVSLASDVPETVSLKSVEYATKFMDWYAFPTNANLHNINSGRNDDIHRTVMEILSSGKAVYQGKFIDSLRSKYTKREILEALEMLEDSKKVELITKNSGPNGGKAVILWRKRQREVQADEC